MLLNDSSWIFAFIFMVLNYRKYDHVISLLHDLHWLSIFQRIDYKISSLVFKSLLGHAASYLPFTRTAQIHARCGLRSNPSSNPVRRATLAYKSVAVGPQIWNRLTPRLPTLIQPDFTPPSKPSSSQKASLCISGLEVLLNMRHSNQTLNRYRYSCFQFGFGDPAVTHNIDFV